MTKQAWTFLAVVMLCSLSPLKAQGWGFTYHYESSGFCPTGAQAIAIANSTLANYPIPPVMSTQNQCESMSQYISSTVNAALSPEYECNNATPPTCGYCTIRLVCSPCKGSDIYSPGQTHPGDVSFNGAFDGTAFFASHPSMNTEDWIKYYQDYLKSLQDKANSQSPGNVPQTGDGAYDKAVGNWDITYSKPQQGDAVDLSGPPIVSDKTIPLMGGGPMTDEERRRAEFQKQYGPNTIDPSQFNSTLPPNDAIPVDEGAGRSVGDAALRTAIGQAPGLIGVAGSLLLNIADNALSSVKTMADDLISGNDAKGMADADNAAGQAVGQAVVKTAVEAGVDKAQEAGVEAGMEKAAEIYKRGGGDVATVSFTAAAGQAVFSTIYKGSKMTMDFFNNKNGE